MGRASCFGAFLPTAIARFVNITMESQLHGVTIIAPCKYRLWGRSRVCNARVCVGQIYFLVHIV